MNHVKKQSTLLEQIRRDPSLVLWPQTDNDVMRIAQTLLQHQSEFPLKLRTAIREAALQAQAFASGQGISEWDLAYIMKQVKSQLGLRTFARNTRQECFFLASVYMAATRFFLGQPTQFDSDIDIDSDACNGHSRGEGWYGLDCTVDTTAEAELAVRFFGEMLRLLPITQGPLERNVHRTLDLALQTMNDRDTTLPFVPLFRKMANESMTTELASHTSYDDIAVDSFYTLIRFDPIADVPKSSASST